MSETPQWMDVFAGKQVEEVKAGLNEVEANKVLLESTVEKVGSFHIHLQNLEKKFEKKLSDMQSVITSQERAINKLKTKVKVLSAKNRTLKRKVDDMESDIDEDYKKLKENRRNTHGLLRSMRLVKGKIKMPQNEDDIFIESDD